MISEDPNINNEEPHKEIMVHFHPGLNRFLLKKQEEEKDDDDDEGK